MAKIFKLGEDLALELPQALIDALGLREGDELEAVAMRPGVIEVVRTQSLPRGDRGTHDRRIE